MENTHLQHTHKHLTLVFTGVTFCIIFLIASSFLFARYYNEMRIQKKDMLIQVNALTSAITENKNFLGEYRSRREIDENRKLELSGERSSQRGRSQLSFFVLDTNENLIFEERIQEPRFKKIDFSMNKIYTDNNTFIVTKVFPKGSIIFYQNIKYQSEDMLRDLFLLLILISLISGGIYFVGYRFVGKALLPVLQNMKDMSDFTHNAGHELKTPLAVMRGNMQIMQAEKKFDTKLLQQSMWQVDTMNSLIESLRELSELGTLSEKENISLIWEIENIRSEFQEMLGEKNIEFLSLTSEKPTVFANKDELHLLLSNLIKNAIKYTEKGGKIEIQYNKNTLSIIDSGVGISPEDQAKIFDRFFQGENARSSDGFGIGLSLVKKIADANNWKIQVESKIGEGTRFDIIF